MLDLPRWVLRAAAAFAALGVLLMPSLAHAQGATVYQNGNVVPGHLAKWFTNGRIGDAGGLGGDANGAGLSPFAITDNKDLGFCTNSALTTGAFNAFCFGHDTDSNALITVDSYNGLANKAIKVRINGVTYDFPGAGNGNVVGPTSPSPTSGHLALWNGGTALRDGGLAGPLIADNATLATTPTGDLTAVWRLDYSAGLGAPPLMFRAQTGACATNGLVADGGSCTNTTGGNSWRAVFPMGPRDPRQFGADPTGVADARPAILACLTSLPPGGWCGMSASGSATSRFKLAATLDFPKPHVGFDCGAVFADSGDVTTILNTMPALLTVSSGGSNGIRAGTNNEGNAIRNCLVNPSGMTFPVANPSASWVTTSTGISDGGPSNGAMSLENVVVIGYDTCVDMGGKRPNLRRVYVDCLGSATAAVIIHNGNSDSGYIDDIRIEPFATGSAGQSSCTATARPGRGYKEVGQNSHGQVFAFNFQTINFEFGGTALGTSGAFGAFQQIVTDSDIVLCPSQFANLIGMQLSAGAQLHADNVQINGSGKAALIVAAGSPATALVSKIGSLWFNSNNDTCIAVGNPSDGSVGAGGLIVGMVSTNYGAASVPLSNCKGPLLTWYDANGHSLVQLGQVDARGINTGNFHVYSPSVSPIFSAGVYAVQPRLGRDLIVGSIATDLAPGGLIYGDNFLVADGAEKMLAGQTSLAITCTGIGAAPSGCGVANDGSDQLDGRVLMAAGGAGIAASGTMKITQHYLPWKGWTCTGNYGGGITTTAWNAPVPLQIDSPVPSKDITFAWTQTGALTAAQNYALRYSCRPK